MGRAGMLMTNVGGELAGARSMDIHRMSVSELQMAYTRGDLTPSAVARHFLGRIAERNGALNAFCEIDTVSVERAAKASDVRFEADTQRPLEGIPIAATASFAVNGLFHHAGMQAREDVRASQDADIVQRLRDAGAIILGTLNMDEAGFGQNCANPFMGTAGNPHKLSQSAGGAAGGAAAAVAAGLCSAALAVDTLGSVRIPASLSGVFGYVPTPQQVSMRGVWPSAARFGSVGVMARSMEDLTLFVNVMFSPDLATAMRRTRTMRLDRDGEVEIALDVMGVSNACFADLAGPPAMLALPHNCATIAASLSALGGLDLVTQLVALGEERAALISDQLALRIEPILSRTPEDFDQDVSRTAETAEALTQQIGANGILMLPSTPRVAFGKADPVPDDIGHFALLANAAGLPSITIPAGRTADNLPLGMMLIGPRGGDAMVIAQARMLNDRLRGYVPPNDL
jgi:aspartyl-tRNA(Asn)/glutamyl-tRNA(Gln) amidotransferase subunit A